MRLLGTNSKRKSGQATLELALVVPFFFVMLFALFEFGRGLVEYTSMSNAAREGARIGIVPSKTVTDITNATRNATITVGTLPAVTVTAFRSGTALADPMTRTSGDTVQVQVTHTFVPIFFVAHGYIPDVIGGLGVSIPMGSTAKMRVE